MPGKTPSNLRSSTVFAAGLLFAGGYAAFHDGFLIDLRAHAAPQISESRSGDVVVREPAPLSARQREMAQAAWSYLARNTQPESGWVNAVEGYPSATLWDQGSYLLGLMSAYRLDIVTGGETDRRIAAFLDGLARIELFDGRLPNKAYDTRSLRMTDYANQPEPDGIGWSSLDIARLLLALRVVERHLPHFGEKIRETLASWDLSAMAQGGRLMSADGTAADYRLLQEGRLGYEQYGARAAALWGVDVVRAMSAEPIFTWHDLDGIDIPIDMRRAATFEAITPVLSEPFLLIAFELGLDTETRVFAQQLLRAQEARWRETGMLTAVSEDHLDEAPYFAYSSVFSNGTEWAVVNEGGDRYDHLRTLSTKAAIGWSALFSTPYTDRLHEAAAALYAPGQGFIAGRYEHDGSENTSLTLNTNGIVLEALHHIAFGPLWAVHEPGG